MSTLKILIAALILALMMSCGRFEKKSDAYGNFEAVDVMVAAENPGKILLFSFNEGDKVEKGQLICITDTQTLYLNRLQLLAQQKLTRTKIHNLQTQIDVQAEQKKLFDEDLARFSRMLADSAATPKQVDDLKGRIALTDKQIESLRAQFATIAAELELMDVQLKNIDLQLRKCYVHAPVGGTMLDKYMEEGEMAMAGKYVCKIADTGKMILRVYVSGSDLSELKNGQQVEVLVDSLTGAMRSLNGMVIWISPQSEFTPKIIQTREERINLVYAVKVEVKNDGRLKIGMPGEINFLKH